MEAHFEATELLGLMEDLASVAPRVVTEARAVVSKGALNVKNAARAAAPNPHGRGLYGASITYDLKQTTFGAEAEIGPDKDKPQGALGNLFEYGNSKGGMQPHLNPALDAEEPRFVLAVATIGERALS